MQQEKQSLRQGVGASPTRQAQTSPEVTYYEFCDELCKMQTRDLNTMMSIMRLSMTELERKVNHLTVMNTRAPDSRRANPTPVPMPKRGGAELEQ